MNTSERVIVIGSGFGGIASAFALARKALAMPPKPLPMTITRSEVFIISGSAYCEERLA